MTRTISQTLRDEAAATEELHPQDSDIQAMRDAADLIDELVLAAKEAAIVIAKTATWGVDPMKGTCLPRLLAAIKRAEAK